MAYSCKQKKFSELAYVTEYNNLDADHVYKFKVNHKSALTFLWRFKLGFLGNNMTHSLGLYTSSVINQDPLTYGFQTEVNM